MTRGQQMHATSGPDGAGLDPITLTVIEAALQQICDEMDLTFSRAASRLMRPSR